MSSPYGPPGWHPRTLPYGPPAVPGRNNGMAVASLATSLAGFFLTGGAHGIVGAILGNVAANASGSA